MAVAVTLSLEAQLEARVLMMSTNNILSPANGKPIIVPSQDIVLGLYYLTIEGKNEPGAGMAFGDIGEIQAALNAKAVTLHSPVKARTQLYDEKGELVTKVIQTTPGRMLLAEILPKHPNLPMGLINRLLTKKEITNVIDAVYRHCGQKETVIFADRMMGLGFHYACRAGISFGKDDLIVPKAKERLVGDAQKKVKEYEQQYLDGLITQGEKYNKVVDVAQDAIIVELDCGTTRGLKVKAVVEGGEVIAPLGERILGRTAAIDIIEPLKGARILGAGELIDEEKVEAIDRAGIDLVMIRSVLTCETKNGVCAACYGRDLARGTAVNVGEAVGGLAGQ